MPDFPTGEIEPSEGPDFLIGSPRGRIGFEVTALFQPRSDSPRPLREQEALRRRVITSAQTIYACSGREAVDVIVLFLPRVPLTKVRVPEVASFVAGLLEHLASPPLEWLELERQPANFRSFPPELDAIVVRRANGSPTWSAPVAAQRVDLSAEFIQCSIAKKNSLIVAYRQRCAEVWLLLVLEGLAPSSMARIPGPTLESLYASDFDRTYLLDPMERSVHRLRHAGCPTSGCS